MDPLARWIASDANNGIQCRQRTQLWLQAEELIYEKLPKDVAQRHVLLLDPVLATGTSAARAVQVCLQGWTRASSCSLPSLPFPHCPSRLY